MRNNQSVQSRLFSCHNSRRRMSLLLLGMGLLLAAPRVQASVKTWDGSYSPYWSAPANWTGGVAPVNGDDLVFPAGAANLNNTNNQVTRLRSITFTGSGYTVEGTAITITNGISGEQPTGANTINLDLTLGASQTFDCVNAAAAQQFNGDVALGTSFNLGITGSGDLGFAGIISGNGYVTKNGAGTVTFSGSSANTYTGTTYVYGGILQLNKWRFGLPSVARIAIPGNLQVGSGSVGPDVVRLLFNNQIADTSDVTINAAGMLDLNGHSDSFQALNMTGGVVTNTGSGTLYLAWDVTATSYGSGTFTNAEIYGRVDLGGLRPFVIFDGPSPQDLIMHGELTAGGISKQGVGTMSLLASNSFADLTIVQQGTLWIENDYALGTPASGTVVSNGAALFVGYGANDVADPLTLAGSGPGSAGALQLQGDVSWNTNVVLTGDTLINCFPMSYYEAINGTISGTGDLTRIGAGTLTIAGSSANTLHGDTYLSEGVTLLNKSGGSAFPSPYRVFIAGANTNAEARELADYQVDYVTVGKGGLLNLNGYSDFLGDLVLNDGGDVQTGAGTLSLSLSTATLTVSNGAAGGHSTISGKLDLSAVPVNVLSGAILDVPAAVSGSGFTKTGTGNMYLFSSNSYNGLTIVGDGILWVSNSVALGTTNFGTVVSNGATLVLIGAIGITNEPLTLNGVGQSSVWGALDTERTETNIWAGPITVNADSTISPWASGSVLRIIGPITGSGGVTKIGSGTLYFEGSTANTYLGTTRADTGTLVLSKSIQDGTIPHALNISGTVRIASHRQTAVSSDVTIQSSGRLETDGFRDFMDALSGSGQLDLGGGGWVVIGNNNGTSTFDGVISGSGSLYKYGSGTITLTGSNTYTGGTYLYTTGTLLVNGYQPASPVGWYSGSTSGSFGGTGVVGPISVAGHLRPGTSPGCLTSSNLTFAATGNYHVELNGPTPCTQYDQMIVRGTNNLANATLDINLAFTTPVAVGQQFTIINNDGTDPITGIFNGYPEGSFWLQNGYKVVISYIGGSGNDVVLRLTQVPGAAGAIAVTAGNGNHLIDPNECNNLTLAISNQSATVMSGVTATLSTTTPGVMVTQPYSPYQDIAANGTGINATPFQVSTLATFSCGTGINLQLVVNSSLGSFSLPFVLSSGTPSVTASRYDNTSVTNVPDIGTVESTNTVSSWAGGPLAKVGVSLWLVAPIDSDLNLTLIAPNGATVDLSSGNGSGANFGTGTADAQRTTFDDDAATSITAGTPPFVGTFRPEGSLASLLSSSPVGNWRLRVQDGFGSGSPDTLRAWSLFLYGTTCTAGGGACDLCLTPITGSIDASDLVQTYRTARDWQVASCGAPKSWPGTMTTTSWHYDVYSITNTTGADACVTVGLQGTCDVQATAYLNSYNPTNLSQNYLGDAGWSTGSGPYGLNGPTAFSCTVPAGAILVVTVNEITPGEGCPNYTLQLSGLPCPPPTLNITDLPGSDVRLFWPSWAGGYKLESETSLRPPTWHDSMIEPTVSNGVYNVVGPRTNQARFFRLNKP